MYSSTPFLKDLTVDSSTPSNNDYEIEDLRMESMKRVKRKGNYSLNDLNLLIKADKIDSLEKIYELIELRKEEKNK